MFSSKRDQIAQRTINDLERLMITERENHETQIRDLKFKHETELVRHRLLLDKAELVFKMPLEQLLKEKEAIQLELVRQDEQIKGQHALMQERVHQTTRLDEIAEQRRKDRVSLLEHTIQDEKDKYQMLNLANAAVLTTLNKQIEAQQDTIEQLIDELGNIKTAAAQVKILSTTDQD